jgi:hypothetical protein
MVTLTQVLVQTHLMVYMVLVDLVIQLTNSQLQLTAVTVATASWSDVDYDAELSASFPAGNFTTVTVSG